MNPNFTLLSEFNGLRKDISRKCNVCGDVRTVKARSLIEKDKNGKFRMCPVCAANKRAKSLTKTHEDFIKELESINNNIEILSEYKTNSDKVKCKCLIDGLKWEAKPHSLLQNHGCPECSHRNQNWRNEERFLEELHMKYPTISPLTKFTRVNDSMKFKCETCGYEWNTSPNAMLNKEYCGCPKCAGYGRVSEQDVIDRLEEKNPRVKYISGYRGILKRAKFKCNDCGNEWETPVNSVLSGRGCPKCNMSHGALKIGKVLDKLELEYETEYRFEDCKDNRTLPFDFYVKSKNTCIEYDGEQHFMPVKFNKNATTQQMNDKFVSCQHRDKIKTNYCTNNGINLIRIPYTDFNIIEEILNKYIS